jgi:hypothetical protein
MRTAVRGTPTNSDESGQRGSDRVRYPPPDDPLTLVAWREGIVPWRHGVRISDVAVATVNHDFAAA